MSACGMIVATLLLLFSARPTVAAVPSDAGVFASGLPARFVPNVSQAHPDVLFEGGVFGRTVSVTSDSIAFADGNRLELLGTGGAVRVRGAEQLPGITNFILGDDPSAWRTAVPNYRAVRFENVYTGVDVIVRLSRDRVTADFQAISRHDLEAAHLRLVDASGETLYDSRVADTAQFADAKATLVLGPGGRATWVPRAQLVDAAAAATSVSYATYLGGGRDDSASAVAVDDTGAAYVTGTTGSANFPLMRAMQGEIASGSLPDAFVAKLNADGTALVYSTYLGGSRADHGSDIAVDAAGRAHVVGSTESRDFPTASALQAGYGGGDSDGYLAVLSRDGSGLEYASFLGGRDADSAAAVAIGPLGPRFSHTYIVGSTKSTDFPTTNAFQPRLAGDEDAFLTVLAATRSEYTHSTYLGGSAVDAASAVAVDDAGAAYVTGYTRSNGFPTRDPMQVSFQGDSDAFVLKMKDDGSDLVYGTYLGGRDLDEGMSIAVDDGRAVVVGYTTSTNFPTDGAYQSQLRGTGDGFVVRVQSDGAGLDFGTFLGGTGIDRLHDVVVDDSSVVHVAGSSESANFPTVDPVQGALNGSSDAVLAALSADGHDLLHSTYFGGSRLDAAYGIAGDWSDVYIVGYTESADLPEAGGIRGAYAGLGDAFVARLQRIQTDVPTPTPTSGASCAIHPDRMPRTCPGGRTYDGRNGGFEDPPGSVDAFDFWYNSFDARRARSPFPVKTGQYSLALNPFAVSVVSNGRIVHDIDLGGPGAPQVALLSLGFWWDGYGSVNLTADIGGLAPQVLVDTSARDPGSGTWQAVSVPMDRAVLSGVTPVILRWSITGRSLAYIDDVDVNFCCARGTPTPDGSATSDPQRTPSVTPSVTPFGMTSVTPSVTPSGPATGTAPTPTLTATATAATPTGVVEPPTVYLPHLSAP